VTVVPAAETRTIVLLLASGVVMVAGDRPCEIDERPYFENPITHDDLLDFHHMLHRDDSWFESLAQDNDAS
jgi:hypothetical protein